MVHEEGDTYVDDGGQIQRDSASLALDWRLTPDIVWSVDTLYQDRKVNGAYYGVVGVGYTPVELPVIDGSRRLASPFSWYGTRYELFGSELNWRLSSDWDLRLSFRQTRQERINRNSVLFTEPDGDYAEFQYDSRGRFRGREWQALLNGRLSTGTLQHALVLGASSGERPSGGTGFDGVLLGMGRLGSGARFEPVPLPGTGAMLRDGMVRQQALFASDTITFDPRWSAIVGLRYTDFRQAAYNRDGSRSSEPYHETVLTPTVAVLFKPVEPVTVYGSYVESLEQGQSAPSDGSASNPNETMPPLKSKQYEIGVKTDHADWGASAALFRLDRGLHYIRPEDRRFTQDGLARYQGLELSAKARLTPAWTVTGGLMWLDAKNTKAAAGVDGKRAEGAPRTQASVYAEYAVAALPGLSLNAGAQYHGSRALDSANTVMLDSYALLDLGARYQTRLGGHDTTFRLNVDNVTDRAYWQGSWGFILTQGAPRTVRASAQIDF
ncbi:TonB-dependent siderophore receptor [Eleftheria terrae]|uniref:TonB-dependent siderophore receptor n=1 Tax=Eleftheria terrae TaxID=1597781 RepID=UPI00263A9356|nr:TonB-dependent receptor [Eleftheria terrae]WKB51330.1 TonB-dependent receptor [Eleftheria terrae]